MIKFDKFLEWWFEGDAKWYLLTWFVGVLMGKYL